MFTEDYNVPGNANNSRLDTVPTQWASYINTKQGKTHTKGVAEMN